MKTHSGFFKPLNPSKYKGNPCSICYRSNWELLVMRRFDNDPNILMWQSEEIQIAYRDPIRNKIRRYFPDLWCKLKDKDGKIIELIIEIKPKKETIPPPSVIGGKPNKKQIYAITTYVTNEAKWQAASEYCKLRGWTFKVITEDDLPIQKRH